MTDFKTENTPITYLVGVLLGVNAIQDSYLWVDSPDCFFFKNDFIQGNHDITSKLRSADGNHKILSTISDADNVIGNRNDKFIKSLRAMAEKSFVKQIFVSSMPMSQIVGTDYDGIIQDVKSQLTSDKPIFNIPSRSMTDCWLEGYADLLFSLAKNIEIEGANPKKENIAIVGNLFDRGEGDCIANVHELRRIFEGLGLNVVSVWLDGGNYEDILKVKEASVIVSLPYGRKAAKKIASRLKIDVLELDLPFGLDKVGQFIRSVGQYFGVSDKAEKFIEKELTEINKIDILKWVVPHTFFGKRMVFYGDPYLLNGVIDMSKTFGFSVVKVFLHGEKKHLQNNVSIAISPEDVESGISSSFQFRDIDLFITNAHNTTLDVTNQKKIQFGFPSYEYHVFTFEPYFGYRGTLIFLNRMANMINT